MSMKSIIGMSIAALVIASASSAATTCSIHPDKNSTDAQLAKLSKVSQTDAERRALARVKAPAKVVGSELQVIDGCLVWALVVKGAGKSAMQALNVDAGTGKVLSDRHGIGK